MCTVNTTEHINRKKNVFLNDCGSKVAALDITASNSTRNSHTKFTFQIVIRPALEGVKKNYRKFMRYATQLEMICAGE